MGANFRTAIVADIPLLLDFIQSFYTEDGDIQYDEQEVRRALADLIENSNYGEIQIIEAQSKPVGYVVITLGSSLEFHGKDAFIDELYITPDHRGNNFGARAIEKVEEILRKRGVRAVHLEVDEGKIRLQEYYRKAGFRDHHRHLMTKFINPEN